MILFSEQLKKYNYVSWFLCQHNLTNQIIQDILYLLWRNLLLILSNCSWIWKRRNTSSLCWKFWKYSGKPTIQINSLSDFLAVCLRQSVFCFCRKWLQNLKSFAFRQKLISKKCRKVCFYLGIMHYFRMVHAYDLLRINMLTIIIKY